MSRITGIVCSPRVYEYKGWMFEVNSASGPWPLRKDGELRARAGRVFWRVYSEWEDLPDDEKQKTRVGGGCVRLTVNAEARSSILLISTKKIRQLDQENLAAFFRG